MEAAQVVYFKKCVKFAARICVICEIRVLIRIILLTADINASNHREHRGHRGLLFRLCVLCDLCGFIIGNVLIP